MSPLDTLEILPWVEVGAVDVLISERMTPAMRAAVDVLCRRAHGSATAEEVAAARIALYEAADPVHKCGRYFVFALLAALEDIDRPHVRGRVRRAVLDAVGAAAYAWDPSSESAVWQAQYPARAAARKAERAAARAVHDLRRQMIRDMQRVAEVEVKL